MIVIVVIGILAAITIVAYNGIQTRGRNAQTIAGANGYLKALRLYQADTGSLPAATGCLGANYPSNQCWSGTNGNIYVSSGLDTALQPYIGQKPTVSTKALQITASDYRQGVVYIYNSSTSISLEYYLEEPGQSCSAGGVGGTELQNTHCNINLL